MMIRLGSAWYASCEQSPCSASCFLARGYDAGLEIDVWPDSNWRATPTHLLVSRRRACPLSPTFTVTRRRMRVRLIALRMVLRVVGAPPSYRPRTVRTHT